MPSQIRSWAGASARCAAAGAGCSPRPALPPRSAPRRRRRRPQRSPPQAAPGCLPKGPARWRGPGARAAAPAPPPRWASHHPTASAAAQPAPRERRWGSEGRPSCTTEQARLRQIAQAAAVRAHARHRRSRAWLPGQSCAEQPRMPSCLVKPEMLPALQSRALHIEGVSTHSDFWAH